MSGWPFLYDVPIRSYGGSKKLVFFCSPGDLRNDCAPVRNTTLVKESTGYQQLTLASWLARHSLYSFHSFPCTGIGYIHLIKILDASRIAKLIIALMQEYLDDRDEQLRP